MENPVADSKKRKILCFHSDYDTSRYFNLSKKKREGED